MSSVTPSVDATDFSCPYCGAHAAQTWFNIYARENYTDKRHPFLPATMPEYEPSAQFTQEIVEGAKVFVSRLIEKEIFFEEESVGVRANEVHNVNISQCFNCKKKALWHNRDLVYPRSRAGALPNSDLNQDIKDDVDEARAIVDVSPRGAAALLRLAVQKLCKQLGESGKNIDSDIQSLVNKGMDQHLQQAFDTVRVIGNEAVHPGELDLRDDRETALALIDLVNIVAQQMITNKKAIAEMYARLPSGKLKGIDDRAKGAAKKPDNKA